MNNNLKIHSAFYLGLMLQRKKIDPVAMLDYFISNFNKANKNEKLSFTVLLKKDAYKEAELSWKRQKKNERLSFYDGIPIVWKDLFDIKGYPAFAGSKLIKRIREKKTVKNAKVVDLAKRNGLISLAKASTVEFAFGGLGINQSCKLPFNCMLKNETLAPGGSSTGSATAVFSGLAPIAVGTDTAGSIRIPAAWHSLVGFKPSSNRISKEGLLPLSPTFDSVGTICKSVKDTQILFQILTNKIKNIKSTRNKKVKIGFVNDFNFDNIDNVSKKYIERLIMMLSKLTVEIKDVQLPEFTLLNELFSLHGSLVNYEAWEYWQEKIKDNLQQIDPYVAERFLIGKSMSKKIVNTLNKKTLQLRKKALLKLDNFDYFLIPTISFPPPKLKKLQNENFYHSKNTLALNNTRAVNIFNMCAISIPMYINSRKWLSISIVGKKNNDEELLSIAEKIESIII